MIAPRHRMAAVALCTLAAACGGGANDAPLGADFGHAVSHNAAQHIVEPEPPGASAGAPEMDGARAADAVARYRTGKVVRPEPVETTTFGQNR